MAKARIEILLPLELKNNLCQLAFTSNRSVNEFLVALIYEAAPGPVAQSFYEKRARKMGTLIPQGTVKKLLEERQKTPPTPYRELARKYGYALRTVHRACTGQGGYRIKVKRTMLGRKSRLSSDQLAAILIDSQTMTISELAKKYPVSRRTLRRAIAGEGCYARKS